MEGAFVFGNLALFIRHKDVLTYKVIVHLKSVADFNLADPTSPPSMPDSNKNDGNPDGHHFSVASGPHLQGFQGFRGVIDGELNGPGAGGRIAAGSSRTVT